MYKVFIDHKPVLFVNASEIDESFAIIHAEKCLEGTKLDIETNKLVSIDAPLQVLCEDVEKEFKLFFSKHTLIEAAGGIVKGERGYLLIKRHGLWDIPKGKMEEGENPRETAVREIEEECGISSPKIERDLCVTYHTYPYKGKMVLKKTHWYYLSYDGNDELSGQLDEGITEAKWMNLQEMLSIRGNTFGSINEVLDVFKKSFL